MSLKRKRSNSVGDLTAMTPPLPLPLTSRPLVPRADSPVSPQSSRGKSRAPKRRQPILQVLDVGELQEHPQRVAGQSHLPHEPMDTESSRWREDDGQDSDVPLATLTKAKHNPGDSNAVAGPSNPTANTRLPSPPPRSRPSTPPPSNLLSTHTCPICFSTVTNACLTPCGHVLCGACLFASVKSGIQRSLDMGIHIGGEGTAARCPVCRAVMKEWDGRGGGIIPLRIRTVMAL